MNNLYFTLASLPHLGLSLPPPFATMEAFWNYVSHVPEAWKSQLGDSPSDPTVKAYRDWDRDLRATLARVRLEGLPWKDQLQDLPVERGDLVPRALEALDQSSPWEVEQFLDLWRWESLEELGQDHLFDQVAFFVYALKLELLQRRSRLVRDQGQAVFDNLHASVLAETDLTITIPPGVQ